MKRDEVMNPFRVDRSMMGRQDPEAFLDEEEAAVKTWRLRGWFYCPLPKKVLKLLV